MSSTRCFFIPAYPLWSLVIITVDAVALYGAVRLRRHASVAALIHPARVAARMRSDETCLELAGGMLGLAGEGAGDEY